ncbi:hypothetical protein RIF29_22074 [Crotalaria pallida]|uniref:Uncharacterized protein n=1 Tax=Crotalaria pallida TaxID=3830 RepID=A0AAN9I921_CROPI
MFECPTHRTTPILPYSALNIPQSISLRSHSTANSISLHFKRHLFIFSSVRVVVFAVSIFTEPKFLFNGISSSLSVCHNGKTGTAAVLDLDHRC